MLAEVTLGHKEFSSALERNQVEKVKCIPVNAIICKQLYYNLNVENLLQRLWRLMITHFWKSMYFIAKCHIELLFKFIGSSIFHDSNDCRHFLISSRHQLRCTNFSSSIQLQITNSFLVSPFSSKMWLTRLFTLYVLPRQSWKCICFSSKEHHLSTDSPSSWTVLFWAVGYNLEVTCNKLWQKAFNIVYGRLRNFKVLLQKGNSCCNKNTIPFFQVCLLLTSFF